MKELERIEKRKQDILISATRSNHRSMERTGERTGESSLMRLNESIEINLMPPSNSMSVDKIEKQKAMGHLNSD